MSSVRYKATCKGTAGRTGTPSLDCVRLFHLCHPLLYLQAVFAALESNTRSHENKNRNQNKVSEQTLQNHKDKNKIQRGAAIKKQPQQRANDATFQRYPPKVGNRIPVRTASHFKCQTALKTCMSAPTDTTTSPGTITNPCYTWAIRLAAGKCRTISTQAKLKAYERQMQKQTDNQNQTGHDAKF